ncbi:MAG: type I-A CRISPR-associated protein Cas7/Csa2 [Candidatus Nitrosocaldaceae archaeon]|nr:MAG: type I-A CRISPR-associated protein Cas7/Csa2 [Candidatus Nitrosocaldaceae archaeon]
MTESVGNYVKHRRVPVMVKENDNYEIYFVPAISGESIAHGFQITLADIAKDRLPICKLCKEGIFLKSTDNKVIKEAFEGSVDINNGNIESEIVKKCFVEDVGGFLYAEKANVKRTSNFYTGYMIPTKEALKSAIIEPQLQSRYALGTKFVTEERGQMIYYVELSSAVYTFAFDLDTKYIGRLTFDVNDSGKEVVEDREERIKSVLDAVKDFLLELKFGSKKTRFLPMQEWESMVITASDKTWTACSPFSIDYIEKTEKKRSKIDYNTSIYKYPDQNRTFEEFLSDSIEELKKRK